MCFFADGELTQIARPGTASQTLEEERRCLEASNAQLQESLDYYLNNRTPGGKKSGSLLPDVDLDDASPNSST